VTREFRTFLAVLVVLGCGLGGYLLIFRDDPGERLRVESVSGRVDHVSEGGGRAAAQESDILLPGERIESADGGRAVLTLGGDSRITVEESTVVKVVEVTSRGVKLDLEDGRVTATIRPAEGNLTVGADGRRVTSNNATFTAQRDPEGTLAVSSDAGVLKVEGVEGVQELQPGQDLIAPLSGAPLRADAAEALLMQVVWPSAPRTRARKVTVTGTTQPGATVSVLGGAESVQTKADKGGQFSIEVPLAEGNNELSVSATSLLGRKSPVTAATLVSDTTAPQVGVTLDF
jgi:hypothetical protein